MAILLGKIAISPHLSSSRLELLGPCVAYILIFAELLRGEFGVWIRTTKPIA